MIVKMKKVSLVVLSSQIEQSLDKLRDLGVVHLELENEISEKLGDLQDKKSLLTKAISQLTEVEEKVEQDKATGFDKAINVAEIIDSEYQKHFTLSDEIHHIEREIDKLSVWGNFNPDDIIELKKRGIDIKLFELTKDQLRQFPENIQTFSIKSEKSNTKLAAVITGDSVEIPFDEIPLPVKSLDSLNIELENKKKELEIIDNEIKTFSNKKDLINSGLKEIDELIEFETAVSSMSNDERISFITGFIPEKSCDDLKKIASADGWGIMLVDPTDEDEIPTLVENPKWIEAIKPVFSLLGTIPGYKEFDISMWFLIFFSIFWAMILGDAGYGMLFLLFTIFAKIKFKKAPSGVLLLLFITSVSTIAWGGMTGNWFGVESLATHPAVAWMLVPQIASFKSFAQGDVNKFIMHMCFIIGGIHLSIAHAINFFKLMPSLKAYGEIGWLGVLWGLFLIIRSLVLKFPANPYTLHVLLGGLALVMIFSEQEGNFLKGIKNGVSNLVLIAFGSIGFFSDIVSYVRLFAVGLATLEVAKSFNTMAAALGDSVFAFLGAAFILFFGHSLNMILGCMSLIVHGVRLNMLEFSGHLNMEWSGFAYKPFKKNINKI